MNSNFFTVNRILITVLGCSALVFLGLGIIEYDLNNRHNEQLYSERSFTEISQILALLVISGIYIYAAGKYPEWRLIALVLALCSVLALIRENDWWLDDLLYTGSWQIFAAIALVFFLVMIYQNRNHSKYNFQKYLSSTAYGVTLSGFLTVFVFSRIFGRKVYWQAVMGENYVRSVKNVAEEGTELFGYVLLLAGAIEFLGLVRWTKKRTKKRRSLVKEEILVGENTGNREIHAS